MLLLLNYLDGLIRRRTLLSLSLSAAIVAVDAVDSAEKVIFFFICDMGMSGFANVTDLQPDLLPAAGFRADDSKTCRPSMPTGLLDTLFVSFSSVPPGDVMAAICASACKGDGAATCIGVPPM